MAGKVRVNRNKREASVTLQLSAGDIDQLVGVAHFYERNMGVMRHLIRLTASREVRRKLRFIQEESWWLEHLAIDLRDEMGGATLDAEFKLPAFVAFWGRILASLNTKRARRKLKGDALPKREALAAKFAAAAREVRPAELDRAFRTRRPSEVEWMRDAMRSAGDC